MHISSPTSGAMYSRVPPMKFANLISVESGQLSHIACPQAHVLCWRISARLLLRIEKLGQAKVNDFD